MILPDLAIQFLGLCVENFSPCHLLFNSTENDATLGYLAHVKSHGPPLPLGHTRNAIAFTIQLG